MSAPPFKGPAVNRVAKVLSTMNGTPCLWAGAANFSKSSTMAGLASDSPNTHLVFGRNSFSSPLPGVRIHQGYFNSHLFFIVTTNRLDVPPYTVEEQIK